MRRVALAGPSTNTIHTAAYFASFIGLGLTAGSLGPTLSDLATQTAVRLNTISYLFMSRSLGYVFGSRGGKVFDRSPGNTVLGFTLIGMAGIMALIPVVSAFWLLLIVMFVLGMAESYLDIGANILLVRQRGSGGRSSSECATFILRHRSAALTGNARCWRAGSRAVTFILCCP